MKILLATSEMAPFAKTGGLALDQNSAPIDLTNVSGGAEIWEKVIRKLRSGAMPPVGLPRPDQASQNAFISFLETEVDRAALANPNPGRALLHRLNRAEYGNAVHDLLALDLTALGAYADDPAVVDRETGDLGLLEDPDASLAGALNTAAMLRLVWKMGVEVPPSPKKASATSSFPESFAAQAVPTACGICVATGELIVTKFSRRIE